ncbi:Gfo/Idh/MocA family protein, partial [Rhodovulum sp. PH10]|uniref:Gfo/Idh/MocA family protein n=1 Tax=Rhodovulum sp. PH10 TaxID=1187851 RepID=UPI00058B7F52
VSCLGATHIPSRVDERGNTYAADADDAAYATFQLAGGVVAQMNSSWCVRVRRDDLVTFQVDGTEGSAVAGLTKCWTQHRVNTPRPIWNPDVPQTMNFFEQ